MQSARYAAQQSWNGAIRLIFLCARADFGPDNQGQVMEILCQGVDWQALLTSSNYSSLFPLLYYRLRGLDAGAIPQWVLDELKISYYTHLLYNERLQEELLNVIVALRRASIDVIVLKGGALAPTIYPNLALRPMCDLDLLVRSHQMEEAESVFETLGFHLSASVPEHMLAFQRAFGGGVVWTRTGERGAHLDVQQHPIGVDWYRSATCFDVEALWLDARPLPLDETGALQLSVEDTLIHLCLHLAVQHGYDWSLTGFVDIDYVLASAGESFSWQRLVERAQRFQVQTAVYYGLETARRLLQADIPQEVLSVLTPGRLRLWALQRLSPLNRKLGVRGQTQSLSGARRLLLYAMLIDRAGGVLRIVREILFPSREWLAVRYGVSGDRALCRCRLSHLLRVGRAFFRSLRRPLIESGLD
ncbi:MAG: nucleotidyltransferase family protein [Anaerolineae bacterium]|nr:nucleotidyltransferase family protein [Anaerolineae bacterium]